MGRRSGPLALATGIVLAGGALASTAAAQDRHDPAQVRVHFDASPGVLLQQYRTDGDDGRWETVCSGPCDKILAADLSYQVTGDGLKPSTSFVLEASGGAAESVAVNGASTTASTVGVVALVTGPVAGVVGLYVALFSLFIPMAPAVVAVAVGGMIASLPLTIAGIVLVVSNNATTVSQQVGESETGVRGRCRPSGRPRGPRAGARSTGSRRSRDCRSWSSASEVGRELTIRRELAPGPMPVSDGCHGQLSLTERY